MTRDTSLLIPLMVRIECKKTRYRHQPPEVLLCPKGVDFSEGEVCGPPDADFNDTAKEHVDPRSKTGSLDIPDSVGDGMRRDEGKPVLAIVPIDCASHAQFPTDPIFQMWAHPDGDRTPHLSNSWTIAC